MSQCYIDLTIYIGLILYIASYIHSYNVVSVNNIFVQMLFVIVVPTLNKSYYPPCPTIPCHTLPYLTLPYPTLPYPTLPYLTLTYLTLPYPTLPYLTLPYLTLPYLTLPYLTLPYLTLPYLTLPYLTLLFSTGPCALSSLRDAELPKHADFAGALEALLRLQKTYRLSTNSLTAGVILGKASHSKLAADDVYELGELAMAWNHSLAVEWFNKSLQMEKQSSTAMVI